MKKIHEYLESILEYKVGDTVYIVTDPDQLARLVYSYTIYPNHIIYNLTQGLNTSGHFAFELSSTREL